jgi:hypothetical protein
MVGFILKDVDEVVLEVDVSFLQIEHLTGPHASVQQHLYAIPVIRLPPLVAECKDCTFLLHRKVPYPAPTFLFTVHYRQCRNPPVLVCDMEHLGQGTQFPINCRIGVTVLAKVFLHIHQGRACNVGEGQEWVEIFQYTQRNRCGVCATLRPAPTLPHSLGVCVLQCFHVAGNERFGLEKSARLNCFVYVRHCHRSTSRTTPDTHSKLLPLLCHAFRKPHGAPHRPAQYEISTSRPPPKLTYSVGIRKPLFMVVVYTPCTSRIVSPV